MERGKAKPNEMFRVESGKFCVMKRGIYTSYASENPKPRKILELELGIETLPLFQRNTKNQAYKCANANRASACEHQVNNTDKTAKMNETVSYCCCKTSFCNDPFDQSNEHNLILFWSKQTFGRGKDCWTGPYWTTVGRLDEGDCIASYTPGMADVQMSKDRGGSNDWLKVGTCIGGWSDQWCWGTFGGKTSCCCRDTYYCNNPNFNECMNPKVLSEGGSLPQSCSATHVKMRRNTTMTTATTTTYSTNVKDTTKSSPTTDSFPTTSESITAKQSPYVTKIVSDPAGGTNLWLWLSIGGGVLLSTAGLIIVCLSDWSGVIDFLDDLLLSIIND